MLLTNFGLPSAPPTLGANLSLVNPNNFAGTVYFSPSVTQVGQFPPDVNFPNWNAGAGGGANSVY